jgi:CcmD family protein
MNFLYAAYTATWLIHITYLTVLVRRYQRLQREIEELNRDKRAASN